MVHLFQDVDSEQNMTIIENMIDISMLKVSFSYNSSELNYYGNIQIVDSELNATIVQNEADISQNEADIAQNSDDIFANAVDIASLRVSRNNNT